MSSNRLAGLLFLSVSLTAGLASDSLCFVCDSDTDCFYVPDSLATSDAPALLVLHCNGALPIDLDTMTIVGDSLGWVMASCHATRNHRDVMVNDADIVRTTAKLLHDYPVDSARVFVFGYSGQGIQALATLFLHPDLFRGAAVTCAHRGSMEFAVWETLADRYVHLATRTADWNRADNEWMHVELNGHGVSAKLTVAEGQHQPGPAGELLEACRWLAAQTAPD